MQNVNGQAQRIKIVLTGGHLAPLLAVIDVLSKKAVCVVIGRKYTFEADRTESLEYSLFKDSHIAFYSLSAGRLQRTWTKHTIPSILKFPKSFFSARRVLKREKPNALLTFGGYIGLPVALAAKSLAIPVVLHEQTQRAGLTSKLIASIADKICISYSSSFLHFPKDKTVLTGLPLRSEVFNVKDSFTAPTNYPILFVTGGSTGSHTLNTYVEYLLPKLLKHFTLIHQTGDAKEYQDFLRLSAVYKKLPQDLRKHYIIKKYILPQEIGWVYKNSDVILSRSGANTVSELIALRKRAVLVPLSHGQKNEQLENAKYYAETTLGTFIEEKDMDLEVLFQQLVALSKKEAPQRKNYPSTDAAEKISSVVLDIAHHVQK